MKRKTQKHETKTNEKTQSLVSISNKSRNKLLLYDHNVTNTQLQPISQRATSSFIIVCLKHCQIKTQYRQILNKNGLSIDLKTDFHFLPVTTISTTTNL